MFEYNTVLTCFYKRMCARERGFCWLAGLFFLSIG